MMFGLSWPWADGLNDGSFLGFIFILFCIYHVLFVMESMR